MLNSARFLRVFGEEAVLARLERLGKNPRTFDNLVSAGFPPEQLAEARNWYLRDAANPVEQFAGQQMNMGFFEDESLLQVFCRFFECKDWKLEQSNWFFSKEDYHRFFRVITEPVEFHAVRLEQGFGEDRWGRYFFKLPFDLGMDEAKRSLWEEICRGDFYWKAHAKYTHLRADNLFHYLRRTVELANFSLDQFHYNWERVFRVKLQAPLSRFVEALERAVRRWQEVRKEKATGRFRYRAFSTSTAAFQSHLDLALEFLGLEPATASRKMLRRNFRRLSKKLHPDHGGSPDEFRRLSACKELVETWLHRR